jgi:hypothetical protein
MRKPVLPPYLGTWDELLQALLHNPFLGSGGGPRPLMQAYENSNPQPQPWSPASALFVMAAALKDVVSRLPEGQNSQLGSAISEAVEDWDDWYCGNGPRPRPHVVETAGELLAFAGTLEAGSLRANIVRQAGVMLEKSFGAEQGQAEVTAIAS